MSTTTREFSEAEVQRMDTAAKSMNRPKAQLKSLRTRLKNIVEDMDPDSAEYHHLQDEISEMFGLKVGSPDVVTVDSDADALEILRAPQRETQDLNRITASLEAEIQEQLRLHAQAASNETRRTHARRVESLTDLIRVVEAAKKIPPTKRTFGCRKAPRLIISGRESIFPDVQFRFHTVTTDDPLMIARLLDYMENPKPGDPTIEVRKNGDVALMNDQTGEFGQWVPADDAEDIIRSTGGAFRRPLR